MNKQQAMSMVLPMIPWINRFSEYTDNLEEEQLRSLLSLFSALSMTAQDNPFGITKTFVSLDHSVTYDQITNPFARVSNTNSFDAHDKYFFEFKDDKQYISELYHINKTITGTSIDTYDLKSLTRYVGFKSISISFGFVYGVAIYNKGSGPLPIDFSGVGGFGSVIGNPQNSISLDSGGLFHFYNQLEPLVINSGNSVIKIGDGSSVDTSYEMLIIGKKELS